MLFRFRIAVWLCSSNPSLPPFSLPSPCLLLLSLVLASYLPPSFSPSSLPPASLLPFLSYPYLLLCLLLFSPSSLPFRYLPFSRFPASYLLLSLCLPRPYLFAASLLSSLPPYPRLPSSPLCASPSAVTLCLRVVVTLISCDSTEKEAAS